MEKQLYEIGMVGLGVMGRSLVLNMAEHGHAVLGYDKDLSKGLLLRTEGAGLKVDFAEKPEAFVAGLRQPRAIMLLVAPAHVVDIVIDSLAPLLAPDDLIIDAGNSYFKDTDRRAKALAARGIRFFGMGVSGGEAGARHGPSMMPGGPREAYEVVRPILENVAAKVQGEPCVSWVGSGSAGHYVKMVHNGIEYALMQLIAESYDLMKRGAGLSDDEMQAAFESWNNGEQGSYLLEITAKIFRKIDEKTGQRLVNRILDVARQKGTGKWTSQDALDLHVPIPTIDAAVAMRDLSGWETERAAAHQLLKGPAAVPPPDRVSFLRQLGSALYFAMIVAYSEGMDLLRQASKTYGYGLNLEDVARIWRGGCIIRARLLEEVRVAYRANPDLPTLLVDPDLAQKLRSRQGDLRAVVSMAVACGLPVPGFLMALSRFDAYRSGWLPANLVQAQRDFFGAHTYERIDEKGTFHTQWES